MIIFAVRSILLRGFPNGQHAINEPENLFPESRV
jgi:hypothetical protein